MVGLYLHHIYIIVHWVMRQPIGPSKDPLIVKEFVNPLLLSLWHFGIQLKKYFWLGNNVIYKKIICNINVSSEA
jgi:hypothetical protein